MPEFFLCLKHTLFNTFNLENLKAVSLTLLRLLISFLISAFFGFILGIISGYYNNIYTIISPIVSIMRSLPTIALLLILTIITKHFYIYLNVFIMFPIIYQEITETTHDIYNEYQYPILLKGKNNIRNITDVIIPLSKTNIILGFIQSLGLGFKVEIMSETFSYNSLAWGLGNKIYSLYTQIMYDEMFSYILESLIIGLIIDITLSIIKSKIKIKPLN